MTRCRRAAGGGAGAAPARGAAGGRAAHRAARAAAPLGRLHHGPLVREPGQGHAAAAAAAALPAGAAVQGAAHPVAPLSDHGVNAECHAFFRFLPHDICSSLTLSSSRSKVSTAADGGLLVVVMPVRGRAGHRRLLLGGRQRRVWHPRRVAAGGRPAVPAEVECATAAARPLPPCLCADVATCLPYVLQPEWGQMAEGCLVPSGLALRRPAVSRARPQARPFTPCLVLCQAGLELLWACSSAAGLSERPTARFRV